MGKHFALCNRNLKVIFNVTEFVVVNYLFLLLYESIWTYCIIHVVVKRCVDKSRKSYVQLNEACYSKEKWKVGVMVEVARINQRSKNRLPGTRTSAIPDKSKRIFSRTTHHCGEYIFLFTKLFGMYFYLECILRFHRGKIMTIFNYANICCNIQRHQMPNTKKLISHRKGMCNHKSESSLW